MFSMLVFGFLILVLYPSALVYCVCLAFSSVIIVSYLVWSLQLSSLLGLLVVLVYLGGMMIMIGYVCAVTPNLIYTSSFSKGFSLSLFVLLVFSLFFCVDKGTSLLSGVSSVTYLFSFIGWGVFFTLACFMLIVLYSATSFTQINSPFRSF